MSNEELIGKWVKSKRSGDIGWIVETFDGWFVIETESNEIELLRRGDFLIIKRF